MSGFKFKVEFSGACVFVPSEHWDRMAVLLLDTRGIGEDVPRHRAVLRVPRRHLLGISSQETGGGKDVIFPLEGVDLAIAVPPTSEGKPDGLTVEGLVSGRSAAAHILDLKEKSFFWVAPLEEAAASRGFPGAGTVFPELLETPVGAAFQSAIRARMFLDRGTLSAVRNLIGTNYVWRFRPFGGAARSGDLRRVVATSVLLEVDVPGDRVDIVASVFTDPPTEVFRLTLLNGDESEVIIDVLNEEEERIFRDPAETAESVNGVQVPPLELQRPRPQDRVFEAFYRITPFAPPLDEVPIPVPESVLQIHVHRDPIAGGSPPCSPSRAEPTAFGLTATRSAPVAVQLDQKADQAA